MYNVLAWFLNLFLLLKVLTYYERSMDYCYFGLTHYNTTILSNKLGRYVQHTEESRKSNFNKISPVILTSQNTAATVFKQKVRRIASSTETSDKKGHRSES